jgi:cytosine permease
LLSFGPQLSGDALARLGLPAAQNRYVVAINLMIGSAGALALVDGDYGRYARRSRDIGIAAFIGNVSMSVGMLAVGGILMYAGIDHVAQYYVAQGGLGVEAARARALGGPQSIAATFVIFGGIGGAVLMLLAQSKAQVLNTYSASLSLANLADALFGWRPGRLTFVVLANLFAVLLLFGDLLALVSQWITLLGVLSTGLAGLVIADYFIVRRLLPYEAVGREAARRETASRDGAGREAKVFETQGIEAVNWAGVTVLIAGAWLAHGVLAQIVSIEFFTSLGVSLFVYPPLRLATLRLRERRRLLAASPQP